MEKIQAATARSIGQYLKFQLPASIQRFRRVSSLVDDLSWEWLRSLLPSVCDLSDVLCRDQRNPPHLLGGELNELMRWKLLKERFRPRLQQLIKSNPAALVKETTAAAFQLLETKISAESIKKSIECLNGLAGVGPATASAILSVRYPSSCPFMAEAAVAAALNSANYNMKDYLALTGALTEKVAVLNKSLASLQSLAPATSDRIVQRFDCDLCVECLWSEKAAQLKPSPLTTIPAKKRGRDTDTNASVTAPIPVPVPVRKATANGNLLSAVNTSNSTSTGTYTGISSSTGAGSNTSDKADAEPVEGSLDSISSSSQIKKSRKPSAASRSQLSSSTAPSYR